MEEEKEYLDYILRIISEKLEEELSTFDELQFKYRRDPNHYGVAYKVACNNLKIYKSGIIKPYFARIDFQEKNKNFQSKLYIGKHGIYDENAKPIIIDWRAPIANLYYDSEIGEASYNCPDGIITGNLLLKRQFEIENGKLLGYHDVDIVSNDVLLQKYLNVNNDMRLKNIVSTIQKEQNIAIRKPINKNTIIQGVAGSGKTTIALHRIAYLVYNYRHLIKNNQYIVIGPNKVFLKYIKSVLPDLDVEDVVQSTYEELAQEIIDEQFEIKKSSTKLNSYLSGKITNDIPKFKSSDEYRTMLDLFLNDYFEKIIKTGLIIKDFEVIDRNKFYEIFQNAINQSTNFENAIEKTVILISNYIEENSQKLICKLNNEYIENMKNKNSSTDYNILQQNRKIIYEEIKKGCKSTIRKYFLKYKLTPTKLYKLFMDSIYDYDTSNYKYLTELKKETLENIKNKKYDFEDLAPLMHIRHYLGIDSIYKNYKHIVIDEAQDLGKFNFYVLKECLSNGTFSIYGDIAQSIYDYRSIDSWQEVMDIIDNCELLLFKKSYRTTDEIMTVANSVADILKLESSELSIRHGQNVSFIKIEESNIPEYIKNKISQYKKKGYHNIAVISKYPTQSKYINDDLSFIGLTLTDVDENTDIDNITNEALTIPNYLSKGLEFDAVIINNADESIYNSNKPSDMKMLYVALTRALHELDVVYSNELTKPLLKFVNQSVNYLDDNLNSDGVVYIENLAEENLKSSNDSPISSQMSITNVEIKSIPNGTIKKIKPVAKISDKSKQNIDIRKTNIVSNNSPYYNISNNNQNTIKVKKKLPVAKKREDDK